MKTRAELFDFIAKQKTAFAASVDEDGFPNVKAIIHGGKGQALPRAENREL